MSDKLIDENNFLAEVTISGLVKISVHQEDAGITNCTRIFVKKNEQSQESVERQCKTEKGNVVFSFDFVNMIS